MVGLASICRFARNRDGLSLTEGLIVFPIMVLVISSIIEFSYGMYQWNQAAKTVQLGARKAAVSCPLTADFYTVFQFDPAKGGDLIRPDGTVVSECGYGTGNACIATQLDRLVNGVAGSGWNGMKAYIQQPNFTKDNIAVIYEQSGLGYHGRPEGPVVSLRIELRNLKFNLPVMGVLLNLGNITVPSFPVTVSSEDLKNGPKVDCTKL